MKTLVLVALPATSRTLSYQQSWPRALAADGRFDCAFVDLARPLPAARLLVATRGGGRGFDVVVLLHSVFSNEQRLRAASLDLVRRLRAPKVWFIGNEYKLMPEKLAFARTLAVDCLVSQLSSERALDLYRDALDCRVVGIPNTGLDTSLFLPRTARAERPIDLGYRAYESPWYLGHVERRVLADAFSAAAAERGLRTDISLEPVDRLDEAGWAAYLDRCRGQLGTEAGGDYFELGDETRRAVAAYLDERPGATFDEVWTRFFAGRDDAVSGRALSGRIVEAAGTKTVQLLTEGEYGGLFHPDVHYIPVRRDASNAGEALDKLADDALCARVTDAAYEVAMSELTYPRLVDRLHAVLEPLVQG